MQKLLGGDLKAVLRNWIRSLQPRNKAATKPFTLSRGTKGKDHMVIFSPGSHV